MRWISSELKWAISILVATGRQDGAVSQSPRSRQNYNLYTPVCVRARDQWSTDKKRRRVRPSKDINCYKYCIIACRRLPPTKIGSQTHLQRRRGFFADDDDDGELPRVAGCWLVNPVIARHHLDSHGPKWRRVSENWPGIRSEMCPAPGAGSGRLGQWFRTSRRSSIL